MAMTACLSINVFSVREPSLRFALHQLGNFAIRDVHIVAYLMTGIPINNDNIHIVNILTLWRCSFSCTDYFGECPEFTPLPPYQIY